MTLLLPLNNKKITDRATVEALLQNVKRARIPQGAALAAMRETVDALKAKEQEISELRRAVEAQFLSASTVSETNYNKRAEVQGE